MKITDSKKLISLICEVISINNEDASKRIQTGFGNSLSAKARQVVEETEKPENEKSETKGHETAEQAMKRLARKALKRAKKKAATNEEAELDLAEGVNAKRLRVLRKHVKDGANPMSPEVKDFMARSFKKTTNANKTRIAPGGSAVKAMEVRMRKKHSAMKEKGLAESDQLDELSPELLGRYIQAATHDSANAAYRAGKLNKPRKQSKEEDALIKKVFKREKGIGRAASKLIGDKRGLRFKIVTESDQLDEGKGGRSNFTNLMKSQVSRVGRAGGREDVQREIGNHTEGEASDGVKMSIKARRAFRDANIDARDKERVARKTKAAMKEQVLSEAGYKRLMRIKKAAYKADLDSRGSSSSDPAITGPFGRRYKQEKKHSRLTRAAAERTTQVAANMARRGGALLMQFVVVDLSWVREAHSHRRQSNFPISATRHLPSFVARQQKESVGHPNILVQTREHHNSVMLSSTISPVVVTSVRTIRLL